MAGLNGYLAQQQPDPGSPEWLQMIAQAGQVPPDQAEQQTPDQSGIPFYLKDTQARQAGRATAEKATQAQLSQMPVIPPQSPGLGAYIMPFDRSLIDQYKAQAQDAMNQQKMGIDQLQQSRNDLAGKSVDMDFSPLAALVDQMNGQFGHKGNLADMAEKMKGMTDQDKTKMLLGLDQKIQEAKAGMTKENLAAQGQVAAMLHGQQMVAHQQAMEGLLADKNSILGNRTESAQKMAAQRQFLNDPINKTYVPRYDGAIKLMDLLDGAERGDYKSNKALLGQMNAEISRLETGSQSPGLNASEKTEMSDAAAAAKNVYDTLTGKVSNVDLSAKFQQARGMVGNLAQSYRSQIDSRNRIISAGATPAQAPIFDAKAKELAGEYEGRIRKLSPTSQTAMGYKVEGPQVGAIENHEGVNYKFKGGDPSNPENWEKL